VSACDAPRLARLNHLSDNSRIVRQAQLTAGHAQRRPADDRSIRLVPEKYAGPIGIELPRCCLGHAHQERLHLVRLMPVVGNFEQRLQAADAAPGALVPLHDRQCLRQPVGNGRQARLRAIAANHQHILALTCIG
jgi:hypothetical protein